MATSPRRGPGSMPPDGGPGGRLHIHGIKEMPAGYDAEVAELFRDLRSASGLSEADLAAQLATRPEVVQALEQGALYALPPWPETYRVVATYGTLLNLDVRPLLRRIYAQVDAGVVGLEPKAMPDVPFMAPPENADREFQAAPGCASRSGTIFHAAATARAIAGKGAATRPGPARTASTPSPGATSAAAAFAAIAAAAAATAAAAMGATAKRNAARPSPRPNAAAIAAPHPAAGPQHEARGQSPPKQPQPRAAFSPRAAPLEAPLEETPAKRSLPWKALIKWGVAALVILGIAAGLWMWLAKPGGLLGSGPAQPGAKSSDQGAPGKLDPNDPRSRKADRLPGPT